MVDWNLIDRHQIDIFSDIFQVCPAFVQSYRIFGQSSWLSSKTVWNFAASTIQGKSFSLFFLPEYHYIPIYIRFHIFTRLMNVHVLFLQYFYRMFSRLALISLKNKGSRLFFFFILLPSLNKFPPPQPCSCPFEQYFCTLLWMISR